MEKDLALRLKAKIEELVSRCETLQQENAVLGRELERCEAELDKKNEKLKEQEKQLDTLRLKEAFLGTSTDRTQARRKISGIIREIDECVNLLND